eukprot:TRINITY_DN3813_c0_g1_i1.p1 TRINITY_DN3813_c0_g1~~TRINITY_DN3813_c0_g1_i1.p1  ORF type:complete len:216 (-),score=62.72 TRINITY_DN3813_c0_g1_i1:156-725(-)
MSGLDAGLEVKDIPADKPAPAEEVLGLDEDPNEETIDLVSCDEKRITLPKSTANMSDYVKGVTDADATAKEIQLKHIKGEILEKIVEWMKYHKKITPRPIPRPLKTSNMKETVGSWDAQYVDCELELVFEVLLAANFLIITPLLELCCAKVASMMLGKTPRQIRKAFNIKEDFTPEEEQQIRKEFAEFL